MTRDEIMAWVNVHGGKRLKPVLGEFEQQMRLLLKAGGEGVFAYEFFEAAVNNQDMFSRIKVVHVARYHDQLSMGRKSDLSFRRRDALREIFVKWGLDTDPFDRMYEHVFAHRLYSFYPVASVEWNLETGSFEEVSIYCEPEAPKIAAAVGRALGVARKDLEKTLGLKRVFAVGYDFRPGKPSRFKLYHSYPLSEARLKRYASAKHYFSLPKKMLPGEYLVLRRKVEGEPFQDTRKVYLPYLERRSLEDGNTIRRMARACRGGALKSFLGDISSSAEGSFLDYIGCEGAKIEVYFGKPAWFWRSKQMEGAL